MIAKESNFSLVLGFSQISKSAATQKSSWLAIENWQIFFPLSVEIHSLNPLIGIIAWLFEISLDQVFLLSSDSTLALYMLYLLGTSSEEPEGLILYLMGQTILAFLVCTTTEAYVLGKMS